jgi:hypothetical protein
MEYNSMSEFGAAGDAWMPDDAASQLTDRMRSDSPFEPLSAGLFTEVAIF